MYLETLEEHVILLEKVFNILEQHKLLIKKSKCAFATRKVDYLGHIVSGQGVATDPSKIQSVLQWPTPKNVKQLRGFLGLIGYYIKFIKEYGMISRPLTELLKKNASFLWTSIVDQAFQLLKHKLCEALVLVVPDFAKQFMVETDACD